MPDFDLGVSSVKNWGLFHPLISWAHSLLNSSFSFLYPGELYSSVVSMNPPGWLLPNTPLAPLPSIIITSSSSAPCQIISTLHWLGLTHVFYLYAVNPCDPLKSCWLFHLLPLSLQLPALWGSCGPVSRICKLAGTSIPLSLHSTCPSDVWQISCVLKLAKFVFCCL